MHTRIKPWRRGTNKPKAFEQFMEILHENFPKGVIHFLWPEMEYQNSSSPITAYCPVHRQVIVKHAQAFVNGRGCFKCGHAKMSFERKIKNNLKYLKQASEKFNGKFDYSKFDLYTPVSKGKGGTIICPDHGEFNMMSSHHFKTNYGCMGCYQSVKVAVKDYESFMEVAESTRDDFNTIDYSKFEYRGANTKSMFRCKVHNHWYEQTPYGYITGRNGCSECKSLKLSIGSAAFNNYKSLIKKPAVAYQPAYVYAMMLEYYDHPERYRLKIGITNEGRIDKRVREVQRDFLCDNVLVLRLLKTTRVECCVIEGYIKKALKKYGQPLEFLNGRRVGGKTEIFDPYQIDTITNFWSSLTEIFTTTEEVDMYEFYKTR